MKASISKIEILRARLCMSSKELQKTSGLPRGTYIGLISGKNVRPETIGRVAKALKVDVADIIEDERR